MKNLEVNEANERYFDELEDLKYKILDLDEPEEAKNRMIKNLSPLLDISKELKNIYFCYKNNKKEDKFVPEMTSFLKIVAMECAGEYEKLLEDEAD